MTRLLPIILLLAGCQHTLEANGPKQLQHGIWMPLCVMVCTATSTATDAAGAAGATSTAVNETIAPVVTGTVQK